MKKLSLYIFLGLIWCNFVSADSINDIKIEGISVGDSALDYFSEKTIKQNSYSYNNKKFTRYRMINSLGSKITMLLTFILKLETLLIKFIVLLALNFMITI